ncbi:MAG: hypothetical protein KF861_06430 [Planctomycetaceae bacterium]|nr:hypothetical protein [Planctomycetaceae bacterium]
MIGLLEVSARQTAPSRRRVLWGLTLLAAAVMVAPADAQIPQPGALQTRPGQFPVEPEEPVKKPNLAERNNITPKPLMTLKEEKEFAKIRKFDYPTALRSQNPTKAEEDTIRAGIRDRVYRMTLPENWSNIANLRHDLVDDIDRIAGDSRGRSRTIALNSAVTHLSELLSDQPEIVKLNAILLLGELNEKNSVYQGAIVSKPAVPHTAAAEPLAQVVQSSDQPTSVKVVAVRGLSRLLKDGSLPRAVRDQVGKVLVNELHAATTAAQAGDNWYQERIIDALGMMNEPRNSIQEPLVVDALWATMLNESLPWHLRTQAARSLSQIRFDGNFNVGLISHEIVNLCGKMTAQYNQRPDLPYWRECFTDLYFAFRPQTKQEIQSGWGLNQQVTGASLRSHAGMVDGAYQQVLKLVNGAMAKDPAQPVSNETLREVAAWMRSNNPTDQKLHPQAKTVEAIQKALAPQTEPTTAVSQKNTTGPTRE